MPVFLTVLRAAILNWQIGGKIKLKCLINDILSKIYVKNSKISNFEFLKTHTDNYNNIILYIKTFVNSIGYWNNPLKKILIKAILYKNNLDKLYFHFK